MKLQDYVEVAHDFAPIVIESAASKVMRLRTLFEEKVKGSPLVPSNQTYHMNLDGKDYVVYQLYVEMLNQAVFAYCIEAAGKNIVIHVRRFEKASVVGGALWNIAKNVLGGQARTIKKEIDLVNNVAKMSKGLVSSSPLGKEARYFADDYFERMNKKLIEAISEV
ncbi:MAG: hypothetical protein KGZ86_07570 [Candidatus Latescibacteria bacterium]|nr:hypothetical protein [Candidatus Latescibacterota bacterium]